MDIQQVKLYAINASTLGVTTFTRIEMGLKMILLIATIVMADKFKVHMMYKDCKEVKAKTMAQHLSLKKKGYTHKKSKDCKNGKK